MERCPITEENCQRAVCVRRVGEGQEPACIDVVAMIRAELEKSVIKQYVDPNAARFYQEEYVKYTRLMQEIYDFTLNEFLLILHRVREDFDAREVVMRYLADRGFGENQRPQNS